MNVKITSVFVLFFLFGFFREGSAQLSYNQFLKEKDVNRKAEMGLELWNHYLRSDMDSLKIASVELLLAASEEENEFARAVGTRMLGSYLFRNGKIDQGLDYMMSSREYFEKKEDFVVASELYNEVGHALFLKGEYDEAIGAYQNSIRLGKRSSDPTAEYNGELGMGKAYIARGDTNVGINFIHDYKRLAIQQGKYEAAADALAYLGMIEAERGNAEISNECYYQSHSFSKKSNSKIHLSHSYTNMAILKFNMNQLDSSLLFFEKALELREELNNRKGITEGLFNLGDYYNYTDDLDRAINYYEQSGEMAKEYGYISDELDVVTVLADIYKRKEQPELQQTFERKKDSLEKVLEEKEGMDQEVISSIDLEFEAAGEEKTDDTNGSFLNWKELTIIVLVVALILFFISERRRIS